MKKLLALSFLLFSLQLSAVDMSKFQSHATWFIPNKGQIRDQANQPNPAVKYLLGGNGMNIQLRAAGFSYDNWTAKEDTTAQMGVKEKDDHEMPDKIKTPKALTYSFHRVDVDFMGANPAPELIPEEERQMRLARALQKSREYATNNPLPVWLSYERQLNADFVEELD